jgi:hypothetical protein
VKVTPDIPLEAPTFTAALDGGGWSMPRPSLFTPGKRFGTKYTGGWVGPRAGLGCSVRHNILHAPGFETGTAHDVASRYTNCAISAATQ